MSGGRSTLLQAKPGAGSPDQGARALCRPDATIDPWLHDLWEKVLGPHPLPLDLGLSPPGIP